MHQLILETLTNQQKEIDELKQMIASFAGQSYIKREIESAPNLLTTHPRGEARYSPRDLLSRYEENLHQNDLANTLRQDLKLKSNLDL
jgi:hypothetical protein